MTVSSSSWLVCPFANIVLILSDQALNLSSERDTNNRRVSKCQPKSILTSSIRPSAFNLSMDIRWFRGSGSSLEICRPTIWMARGTAARARGVIFGSSSEMVVVSSM